MGKSGFKAKTAARFGRWERDATLPGWWTLVTVGGVVVLAIYIAFSMIASSGPSLAQPAPRTPAAPMATSPVAPSSPAPTTDAGDQGNKLVLVPTVAGGKVEVPARALALARLSFEALYDPAAAAKVPTVDGSTAPVPSQSSAGTISGLVLMSPTTSEDAKTSSTLLFGAKVDVDGKAERATAIQVTRTLVKTGDLWALNI